MNKVITINLNGNAFQLEENAYEMLRTYLENAGRKLAGNPDQAEIIADIEQAIGDKCRASLGEYRTVVSLQAIETILGEMGPVDDGSAAAAGEAQPAGGNAGGPGAAAKPESTASASTAGDSSGPVKRLYRLPEGAMFAGVCNGLAAYFGVDVTFIRLLFVLLSFVTLGLGLGAYLVMMIIVPSARTSAEKSAAFGSPSTAQEFIRRAAEGYYEGMKEGMKNFRDKDAHREWKRRFKEDMRSWRRNFREEMRANAFRWHQRWAPPGPGLHPAFLLAWPLLALIRVLLTLAFVAVLLSLVFTGAVFGLLLPWGMPMWVGIVVLVIVFNALLWPFRWHRYACGYGCGGPHPLFGLVMLALCLWLADRYVPHVHEVLMDLPPFLHHAADSFRTWWNRH
ncbi:MAG: PspC domain-containing protein [Opitutales bacterium]